MNWPCPNLPVKCQYVECPGVCPFCNCHLEIGVDGKISCPECIYVECMREEEDDECRI